MNRRCLPSFSILLILWASSPALSQPADRNLEQGLHKIMAGFHGAAGVYVRNLLTGESAGINADSLFPTASMIKVPILCTLFSRIEQGTLGYEETVVYHDSLKYDDGITGSFRDSTVISIRALCHLMISMSDNTASLWLQQLAGTGTAINTWLEENGFHATRVNSRTPGRQEMRAVYGWGMTTPKEMAELLVLIRSGKAVSTAASREMYRILSKSYWDKQALSQLPLSVQVASKQGAVSDSRSEVVLVNAPRGDYVFCIITKNQADRSWEDTNEGYTLIRAISGFLWNHFESPVEEKLRPKE